MLRYADRPMDFADATLVHVAEREGLKTILTIDHDDFETYRIGRNAKFRILPARVKIARESAPIPTIWPVVHQKKPWLWGPLSLLGLGIAILAVAIDQLHKCWMLGVYDIQSKGRVAVTPFLDLVFVKNTGISYGLFLQDTRQGQWVLAGFAALAVFAMACWLARGVTTRAGGRQPRADHGRGRQQCHRPPGARGRRRLLLAARLRVLLVCVQSGRCGHCCRRHRAPL